MVAAHRATMTYLGTFGAVTFRLERTGTCTVPAVEGGTISILEGSPLVSVREGDDLFLVLDHRPQPDTNEPAYVEFWVQVTPSELPVRGMLVLCPSNRAQPFSVTETIRGLIGSLAPVDGLVDQSPAQAAG